MPNISLQKVSLRKATETKKTKAVIEKYMMKMYNKFLSKQLSEPETLKNSCGTSDGSLYYQACLQVVMVEVHDLKKHFNSLSHQHNLENYNRRWLS